ncbi:MAG TPA: hypothetical protein VF941_04790, partial [Clostridia bacterium]
MKKNAFTTSLAAALILLMSQNILFSPVFASTITTYTVTPQINTNRLINGNNINDGKVSVELNQSQKLSFVNGGNLVLSSSAIQTIDNNDLALLLDTSDNAVPTPPPTDLSHFAIFTGDSTGDLTIKGTTVKINGDIHSNGGISFMASSLNIKGTCETVKDIPAGLNTTNYTWLGVANIN